MYQLHYPIIKSIPPLNTAMPWDILLAYIYTDSIAQFDNSERTVSSTARWATMHDTLAGLITYNYKMTDYNPIIFTQYLNEISLNARTRYRTSIIDVRDNIRAALLKAAPKPADRLGLYSLLYPDYILRVRITGIDSMLIKPHPSLINPYKFRATADVIDTLKGMVFTTCAQQFLARTPVNEWPNVMMDPKYPCIEFQYSHGNYFDPNMNGEPWLYPDRDPSFAQSDGGFQMQVGQEAIVFLSHYGQRYDSTKDYFDLNLEPQASYNALPIINGQVRDINHIWSGRTMISYDDWKARFYELREKILTGKYN